MSEEWNHLAHEHLKPEARERAHAGGTGPCGGTGGESGYLNQTLKPVAQQNYQRVTINTIGVMMSGRGMQETFLRNIARSNGGTYKRIN